MWFGLFSIAILYLAAYNFPADRIWPAIAPVAVADRIRWVGILLEALSISLIAVELSKSVVTFKGRGLRAQFRAFLSDVRFVFVERPAVHLSANMNMGGVSSVAIAASVTQGGSLEQRVANLESSLEAAQKSIRMLDTKFRKTKEELEQSIEKEARKHETELEEVRKSLEHHAVGNPAMQVTGLLLHLLSIFLANAPGESAWALRFIGIGAHAYW
jgi:hypothetical protein